MSKPRQTQHFAEIEYCLQNYFNSQLAPVMKEAQTYLTQKQVEEIGAYHASTAGVLRSLANGANGMPDDSLPYLRQTGEWNSKTTEDYVAMCRERIAATPETVEDLSLLAGEWRNAVVAEIGREQYEELSKELGGDLAFAYVDYRVEQMMIDRMAVEQMPKSSVEYILRKGAEGSLLGLAQGMMKSPLQQEIERRGEAAYRPSGAEKAWGTAVGVGMDTVMMGGISSWVYCHSFSYSASMRTSDFVACGSWSKHKSLCSQDENSMSIPAHKGTYLLIVCIFFILRLLSYCCCCPFREAIPERFPLSSDRTSDGSWLPSIHSDRPRGYIHNISLPSNPRPA